MGNKDVCTRNMLSEGPYKFLLFSMQNSLATKLVVDKSQNSHHKMLYISAKLFIAEKICNPINNLLHDYFSGVTERKAL